MMTRRTTSFVIVVAGLLGMTAAAVGQEISIFFPPEYENVEAPATDTRESETWPNGARIQWAIPAEAFTSLPETHRWLTELRNRPDSGTNSPRTMNTEMIFRISTTEQDPENLSFTFADNVGDDEMVIIDGPITWSTENIGPPEGPRAFDIVMEFEKPFYYDPSQGNLLIDWTLPTSTTWTIFEDATSVPPGGAVWNVNAASPVATNRSLGSLVWQAVFVPEPSSTLLCLLGLLGVLRVRRPAG